MAVRSNVPTIPAALPPLNLMQVALGTLPRLLGKFESQAVEEGKSMLLLLVATRRTDFPLPLFGRARNPCVVVFVVVQTRATTRRNNVRKVRGDIVVLEASDGF